MTDAFAESLAVVVLPAVGGGRLENLALRRWLARTDLQQASAPGELLSAILKALNLPHPDTALGALRMWGQTGERPTVWIAAADPVYLEPRLDHLCLHALGRASLPAGDLRALFDHLQNTVTDGAKYSFVTVGTCSYLRASESIATAAVPPYVVHLDKPNEYMPTGPDAAAYRRLVSEVEMALHEHEINTRRESEGLPPINCLWFWGGGYAPEQRAQPHPPLFADDPLLRGYWLSKLAPARSWPGSIAACLDESSTGFVAVAPPDDDPQLLMSCLQELRRALRSGRLSRLQLIFRDGVEADILRQHSWRIWRRNTERLN